MDAVMLYYSADRVRTEVIKSDFSYRFETPNSQSLVDSIVGEKPEESQASMEVVILLTDYPRLAS